MIRAIIFDFGRVISAQKPAALFRGYEEELGLEPGTINTTMFDSPYWQQALVGEIDMEGYWRSIGPQLNLHSKEAVTAFHDRYYRDERLNTDVIELIKIYRSRYTIAILSNHPAGLMDWLNDWNIAGYFDVVYCSGVEGAAKPDPRAYHTTLQRLDISAGEAIFIDDTPGHVAAARDLGMHGIVFTTATALQEDLAAYLST